MDGRGLYFKVADFIGLIHRSYSVVLFSGLIITCSNHMQFLFEFFFIKFVELKGIFKKL